MEGLVSGDVVILPFPFTDLRRVKSRPAIILGISFGGSYIIAQITTQPQRGPHALRLEPSDFAEGSLTKSSFVRVDMVFTIIPNKIKRKAGHVHSKYLARVNKQLFDYLELQRLQN